MRFRIDTFTITVKKEERKILRTRGGFTGYHPKYYVIVGKKTRRPTRYEYKKIYKKLKERRETEKQNEKQGESLLVSQNKKKEDKMKVYKGMRLKPELETASDVKITVEEGKEETLLRHHVHHSPTGFCWGYGGSGPSDLARSILWDYLGKEPSSDLYQEFKWEFVATWKAKWQITSAEIGEWIKGKFGKDYFDYLTKTDQSDPRD